MSRRSCFLWFVDFDFPKSDLCVLEFSRWKIHHKQTSLWHQCFDFCATHQSSSGDVSLARPAFLSERGGSNVDKLSTRNNHHWTDWITNGWQRYPPYASPGLMYGCGGGCSKLVMFSVTCSLCLKLSKENLKQQQYHCFLYLFIEHYWINFLSSVILNVNNSGFRFPVSVSVSMFARDDYQRLKPAMFRNPKMKLTKTLTHPFRSYDPKAGLHAKFQPNSIGDHDLWGTLAACDSR